jgi:YVTN family beta-propeller protein
VLGGGAAATAMTSDRSDAEPTPGAAPFAQAPRTEAPSTAAPAPLAKTPLTLRGAVTSLATPEVIDTFPVGDEPEGVTVSPDGATLYVANQNSRVLSVVDARTHRVTGVRLRNTPRFVTTSRDGRLVFVSMYEQDKSGSGVAVVDAGTRKVLRYLATGVQPYTLAFGPDDRLWVPIHSRARLEVYTADGRRPDARITVPPNPHAVAFSEKFGRAFVASHESNSVSAIDLATNKVLRTIPVSRSPHSVAVSPDGHRVLVAGYDANTADLIDARTMRRTGPVRVGDAPQCVLFARDSVHAYVVNEGDNTISVLDGRTGKVTATVEVGRSPRTAAVSPDGRLAYVTNGDDDTVSVLRVGS